MEVNLKIQTLYSMVRSTKISNRGFLILQEMILVMNKSYFTEKRFSSKMFIGLVLTPSSLSLSGQMPLKNLKKILSMLPNVAS